MSETTRSRTNAIVAAGAVVWRETRTNGIEVCLVHRPKYDDWSLPKGKRHDSEHLLACAVREVAEETGHHITLGRPLPVQRYDVDGRPKVVHYWAARADAADPERAADHEVDDVAFLPAQAAMRQLTHARDAEVVAALAGGPLQTSAMVLVRHAKAVSRSDWDGSDILRPLEPRGQAQAVALAAPLRALGVQRAVTSDAIRCVDTLRPWSQQVEVTLDFEPGISEEGYAVDDRAARDLVAALAPDGPSVVCSHRPVLPALLDEAGAPATSPLSQAEFVVVHHRGGLAVATERHLAITA